MFIIPIIKIKVKLLLLFINWENKWKNVSEKCHRKTVEAYSVEKCQRQWTTPHIKCKNNIIYNSNFKNAGEKLGSVPN